jgi:hypothetical protein
MRLLQPQVPARLAHLARPVHLAQTQLLLALPALLALLAIIIIIIIVAGLESSIRKSMRNKRKNFEARL